MDTESPQENKKKLYVGNLPWSLGEEEIRGLFEPFGEIVEVKLITEPNTGRSKGFAFVEYAEEASAVAAIEGMNEHEVDGRNLFVKVARPKQPRREFGGGGYRGGNRGGYGGNRGNDRGFSQDNDRRGGGGYGHRG